MISDYDILRIEGVHTALHKIIAHGELSTHRVFNSRDNTTHYINVSILAASRAFHVEAVPVFYRINEFYASVDILSKTSPYNTRRAYKNQIFYFLSSSFSHITALINLIVTRALTIEFTSLQTLEGCPAWLRIRVNSALSILTSARPRALADRIQGK